MSDREEGCVCALCSPTRRAPNYSTDQAGGPPVLLRIEAAIGHGLGKPKRMLAAEYADMLAFAAEHTGLTPG